MFLCAGCGADFSPWAARCSECGRPADDAVEVPPVDSVQPADSGHTASPAQAVAPDRQPPGWLQRHLWVALAGAAVVVWLVAALSWQLASAGGGRQSVPGWVRALSGQVVSLNEDGALVVSAADGSHPEVRPDLGLHDSALGLLVPADARFVIDPEGGAGAAGGAQTVRNALVNQLGPMAELAMPNPFSDAQHAVIVLSTPGTGLLKSPPDTNVSLEVLSGARILSLGVADTAAGDPRTLGAFVTVPAAASEMYGVDAPRVADLAVQLRDVSSPVVTLATAAQLEQDLHQGTSTAVNLVVYPDPTGDKVAVVVSPISDAAAKNGSDGGVVVLDRSGRLLGVGPPLDPAGGGRQGHPTWSPDGKSLAYVQSASADAELVVWTLGERATTRAVAGLPATGACMWGPNDQAILCPLSTPRGGGQQWAVGRAKGGSFATVAAPGIPEAWVAAVNM